jgi:TolA-binding protein
MTSERPSSLREQAELQRMLRGLGQLDQPSSSPRTPSEEHLREERIAARIDQQVAELTARRRSRRFGFTVLAAAVVVLSLGAMRHLRWDAGQLTIEQEPLAASKEEARAAAPSVATPEPLPPTPPRLAPATARAGAGSVAESAAKPAPSAEPVDVGSTLAQENQLFRAAAEASRTGDVAGALSRLQQLLDGYPASPLAQGALVRKFRLLASAGRSEEARHEAERYLAAYPTGFAVAEAEALKKGEGAVQQPPSAEEPEGP